MEEINDPNREMISQAIWERSGVGFNDLVESWQNMLGGLLDQLGPFLKPSRIVTFRNLTFREKKIFEEIAQRVEVPGNVCGVFLSPSVRNQMLYTNQGRPVPREAAVLRDNGALLFTRVATHTAIVNALLAYPPYAPAIDVYVDGALMAGYVYESIDECLGALSGVVKAHLGR